MPKFYRKNKKKNNPRYFLKEGIDNDLETLSEEQDESPNGWCFSPDGSITPSTGTRDGKPACRGADDTHRPEQTKALAVTAFKKMQVAEQKKSMDSIMGKFRNFLNEGFELDKNKDGELSSTALRDMAAQLDRNKAAKLSPDAMKSDIMLSHIIDKYTKARELQARGLDFDDIGFHGSVMYRILRSGNPDGAPGNEAQGVEKALDYFYGFLKPGYGADPEGAMMVDSHFRNSFPEFENEIEFVKQTIDLELSSGKGGTGPNFEPTPFGGEKPRAFLSETYEMAPVNAAIDNIKQGLNILQASAFAGELSFAQREEIAQFEATLDEIDRIAQRQSSL